MSGRSEESAVERLRKQAERALAAAQSRRVIEPILERILSVAPTGSEASVFAHRHLAEYRIEEHPWRALLHLRHVAQAHPDDDVVHALMGLSQALLGNFRCAVEAYRRALQKSPDNPWYHHNLGHLLDVGLDRPASALRHLELAHGATEPPEHEITASLAHCLARVGRLADARAMARSALAGAPANREHKQLVEWIERGAPDDERTDPRRSAHSTKRRATARDRSPARGVKSPGSADDVVGLLDRAMREAGFSGEQVARARRLWTDYRNARQAHAERVRLPKADVCAAAIEYAIARLHRVDGVTRASVARRYGVSPRSVSERWGDIQVVLALKPDDPRYAARR